MSNDIEHDAAGTHKPAHRISQFNVCGMFSLTAAFAVWLFLLPDFRREPAAVAIFWTFAVVAGIAGDLLYTYLFPWRGTVVTSVFMLSVVLMGTLMAISQADFSEVIKLLMLPIDQFAQQRWSDRVWLTTPVFACIAILTAAHPIKPGLIHAIITAIGITMWYGFALMIGAAAG